MLYIKNIGFGIILHSIILCGSFSNKGMLTLSGLTSNNVPNNWAPYESSISYIPTISITKELSNQTMFDIEWSYYLKRDYKETHSIIVLKNNIVFGQDIQMKN